MTRTVCDSYGYVFVVPIVGRLNMVESLGSLAQPSSAGHCVHVKLRAPVGIAVGTMMKSGGRFKRITVQVAKAWARDEMPQWD